MFYDGIRRPRKITFLQSFRSNGAPTPPIRRSPVRLRQVPPLAAACLLIIFPVINVTPHSGRLLELGLTDVNTSLHQFSILFPMQTDTIVLPGKANSSILSQFYPVWPCALFDFRALRVFDVYVLIGLLPRTNFRLGIVASGQFAHVWVEQCLYLWIHVPDQPRLFDKGWSRKIRYPAGYPVPRSGISGIRPDQKNPDPVHPYFFKTQKFISTHPLGRGELIWIYTFLNFSPKKALRWVVIILVFLKKTKEHIEKETNSKGR